MSNTKPCVLLIPLAALALFTGCTENPVKDVVKDIDKPGGNKPVVLSLVQSSGLDVSGFQKTVAGLDKINKVMDGAGARDIKVETGLQGIGGTAKGGPTVGAAKGKMGPGAGGRPKSGVVVALLKPSAGALAKRGLAKRAAEITLDSTWWDSSKAAMGSISQIHLTIDDDPQDGYTAKDSTVYKLPYNDTDFNANKVMHTSSSYRYVDGSAYWTATLDDDGDGILNGAPTGKPVLIVKINTSTRGDTVSKSVYHSEHGNVTAYDSLGDGRLRKSTDSTLVKGKATWWQKSYDGDGDGYAGTAEPGKSLKTNYESWSIDSAGYATLSWNGYGAGPDNEIDTWEDNTTLPGFSATVNSRGDTVYKSAQDDLDGDGIINGYAAGKTVQVRNSYWYKAGDTVSLSVWIEDYGKQTLMDSLWKSNPVSWTDSTFIKGKVAYWHKTYDGDGDGFVNTAAAGKAVMVKDDSYAQLDDTTFSLSSSAYGAGPDRDYTQWEDNEQYPSSSHTTNPKGETTAKYAWGDADGDGFYYAKGAANKVWEANQYFNQNEQKSYQDSTVKLIGDIATGDDDKVLYNTAAVVYLDGSTSNITTAAKGGKESFGEKDTITVNEKYTYTGYIAKDNEDHTGDQDSTVRITYMIPNDLAAWEDDEIVWSSSKAYYKKGLELLFSSEVFTARKPMLSGGEPVSGTYEREERYSASAETDVNRWREWQEFDNEKSTYSSRNVHYYVRGDSTVETGSQVSEFEGTYAKNWDDSTRNTGWYNNNTHEFKDTVIYLKAKDKDPAKDISWGTYNADDGTGDYWWKQFLANGDSAGPASRSIVKKLGEDHMEITSISDGVTSTYKTHKDTTFWEDNSDSVKTVYSSISREDGSYLLMQETKDAKGAVLLKGSFVFLPDGSGYGSLVEYKEGTAQTPITLKFDLDGTTYVNGVAITDEPVADGSTTGGNTSGG